MSGIDLDLRQQAVAAAQRLDALGLNRGSTGSLSVRASERGFWPGAPALGPQPGLQLRVDILAAEQVQVVQVLAHPLAIGRETQHP